MSQTTDHRAADTHPTLASFLSEPIEVGSPDSAGPLTVFPLIGPTSQLDYRAFATARR